MQHDAVAQTPASESPSLPQSEYPSSERYASAVHQVVSSRLLSRTPGGHWKVPDVAIPPDTFLDFTIAQWHAVSAPRLRADGRSNVLHALCTPRGGGRQIQHYRHEQAPGGPLAPGTGKFVPFAVIMSTSGGLLAPCALSYLKILAHECPLRPTRAI